jgi:2',3'-cyclic-nucleotide 2'-phosphodiesterase (5'-nucleotidase family)
MKMIKTLAFILSLLSMDTVSAKLLQIIHTNDLHSFFEGTRGGKGGYARLKTVVDELRAQAEAQKIPTLFLDGGDFGEGSSFYFSNKGVDSLKALDHLGIDATVLGNHDFILGGRDLRRQILQANLKTKILSANVRGKRFMGLKKLMPSWADYDISGMKVRVVGLTTSEIHYQYPFRPLGYIANSHRIGINMAEKAQRQGVDFLIALTHIGLDKDIALVRNSRTIDLVVGGHSHTKLHKPEMTKNLEGRKVPVLQAGSNSLYVGSLLMDIQPKGESVMVDYRMYDITHDIPENLDVKQFVQEAYENRDKYFNRSWKEVIGFSDIKLSGSYNGHMTETRTCWSQHIARLTRETANTDLGLQFDSFQGEEIPAGEITFGDMVDNFPHFRKWNDQGWKVGKATVSGFLLKKVLQIMASSDIAFQVTIDGLQAKLDHKSHPVPYDVRRHPVYTAMINGQPINSFRYYSVAMPSEVPHGMMKLLNVFGYVILNQVKFLSHGSYWPILEDYIKRNSPIRCLED